MLSSCQNRECMLSSRLSTASASHSVTTRHAINQEWCHSVLSAKPTHLGADQLLDEFAPREDASLAFLLVDIDALALQTFVD